MKRLSARLGALVILLMLPAAALAQKEPPHTKETKSAEKFIGLAMTRQDAAQRRQFLEQALPPLREAMQKNPENARVWVLAGSVFSGLGDLAAADSAFDKAVELHPGYAEPVSVERHAAWETAFNQAVGLINRLAEERGRKPAPPKGATADRTATDVVEEAADRPPAPKEPPPDDAPPARGG